MPIITLTLLGIARLSFAAAPDVTSAPPKQIAINEALNYRFQASDADNDTIAWSIVSSPDWITQSDSTDVSTFAGTVGSNGSQDGIGAAARFGEQLYGVEVGPQGNIYVTEEVQGTIRKITPSGVVTTLEPHPQSPASILTPVDIAIADNGDLYIVGRAADVIYKMDATNNTVSYTHLTLPTN